MARNGIAVWSDRKAERVRTGKEAWRSGSCSTALSRSWRRTLLHPAPDRADVGEVEAYVQLFGAAVWPLTVLAVASAFRRQLIQLVARLTKARVSGVGEFDFDLLAEAVLEGKAAEEEKAVAEDQDEEEPGTTAEAPDKREKPDDQSGGQLQEPTLDTLMTVARHSPRAAIMQAWTEVEMAIHPIRRQFLPVHRNDVISQLEKLGVVSEATATQFVRLKRLRNEAAHAFEVDIDVAAAQSYAKLAHQLADEIAQLRQSFDDALRRLRPAG